MRTKSYFKSSELAHVFAHRGAPEGRCPSAETFRGDTYYSYNTPIAQLVKGKGGVEGVILNCTSYSITTSGHQSNVRGAVSHVEDKFYVDGISRGGRLPSDGKSLRDHYLNEYLAPWTSEPSRYAHVNAQRFLHKVGFLEKAIEACKFFGLATKKLEAQRAKLQPEIDAMLKVTEEQEAKLKIAWGKRDAQQREHEIQRHEREIADAIVRAEKFVAGTYDPAIGHNADFFGYVSDWMLNSRPDLKEAVNAKRAELASNAIEEWRNGSMNCVVQRAISGFTLLRREGFEIVTSLGARIPYEHGQKAFAFVKRCHDRGEGFHCNGRSIKVGHYEIESIDPDGTVHAGCHKILFSEIAALAEREHWDGSLASV